jgi:hemoglobin
MTDDRPTLYERLGGDEAIGEMIYDFYRRVFSDPELSPFFTGVSQDRLQTMQREFFSAALDGPIRYTGRPIYEAHAGLGIELRHLSRFLDHLMETLADRQIDEQDRYDIRSRINTYADEITGVAPMGE